MQIDVGKLVGAASAPVALIIAAAIFLGNIGGKYAMLAGIFRQLTDEYRKAEDRDSVRSRSLTEQLSLYSQRLRMLMRATLWLSLSILCFIATVVCTSISVLMPKAVAWTISIVAFSFTGMLALAGAVMIEMVENHRAKRLLVLETAEFSDVLPQDQEDEKRGFRIAVRAGEVGTAQNAD